jgi:hypothetical protein
MGLKSAKIVQTKIYCFSDIPFQNVVVREKTDKIINNPNCLKLLIMS